MAVFRVDENIEEFRQYITTCIDMLRIHWLTHLDKMSVDEANAWIQENTLLKRNLKNLNQHSVMFYDEGEPF